MDLVLYQALTRVALIVDAHFLKTHDFHQTHINHQKLSIPQDELNNLAPLLTNGGILQYLTHDLNLENENE